MDKKKIVMSILAAVIAISSSNVLANEQQDGDMVSVLGRNKEESKISQERVEAVPTLLSTIDSAIAEGICQKSSKESFAGALECLRVVGVDDDDILRWRESDERLLNVLDKYPRLASAFMTRDEESTIYSHFTTKENLSKVLEDKDVQKAISEYLHPSETGEYGAGKVSSFYKALEGKEATLNSLTKMISNNPELAFSILTTDGGLSEKEAEDFIVFTDSAKVEIDSNGEVWHKAGSSSSGWELTSASEGTSQGYTYTFSSENKEMERFVQSRGIKHTEEQPLYIDATTADKSAQESKNTNSGITEGTTKESSNTSSGTTAGMAATGIVAVSLVARKLLSKKPEEQ